MAVRDTLVRRSLLAVSPLDVDGLARAAASGADAVVLDVARGAAAHRREEARRALGAASASLVGSGVELLLWTDAPGASADLVAMDMAAGVVSGALVTANSPDDVAAVDAALGAWEASHGVDAGTVNVEVVLASGAAVQSCAEIAAASPRVVALALDEDALLRAAGEHDAARRDLASCYRGALVMAARSLGVQAHGAVATGAGALAAGYAAVGRRMGLRGALCFDANVVSLVNAGFSPGAPEVEAAGRVLSAMAAAVSEGRGAIAASTGTMADLANVRQARAVVARAEAIASRSAATSAEGASGGEGSAPPWR
ncbi:MAG: aldolase/citrate lyase family protein [Chloroflexota bacterium]|nr:aldolase/citrate lyase family protein [Chloroflexota bacterium]